MGSEMCIRDRIYTPRGTVIIDVRQSQVFLLGTINTTAHGMLKLFVRPQPLCLWHVPSRSASRPLTSLASKLNEHQLQQHPKESGGKDHYRKREGCCPAPPRFGYPLSPVTYTRITAVYTIPGPAQEEPTSYIVDCGCLPAESQSRSSSSSSSNSSSK